MKKMFFVVVILVACGCASRINLKNLPQVDAYSPGGTVGVTVEGKPVKGEDVNKINKKGGLIFVFEEGDIIDLTVKLEGNDLESIDGTHAKVKRKMYFYVGKGGAMISSDGKNFHPVKKIVPMFSFEFSVDDQTKTNKFTFGATTQIPAR